MEKSNCDQNMLIFEYCKGYIIFLSTLATALDQFGVMIDPTQSKKVVEELSSKMSLFKTKLNEMSDEQAKAVVVEDQLQVI